MVDINQKLSSRAVSQEDVVEALNREIIPVVEKIRLALVNLQEIPEASFLVGETETELPGSLVLTAGSGVTLTPGTGTLEISASGGAGTGDVVGPAVAVADRIATFDGVTGKLIQDGGSTIAGVLATADAAADAGDAVVVAGIPNTNARVAVSKNSGATVGTRREINFIEGANITLTIADDAGNEEVDVTIAAAGGSAATFLQGTADFGTTAPRPESVSVTIADAGVGAASKILVSLAPGTGRGVDEFELSPLVVTVGAIVAGVSFDVLVCSLDGDADGQFTVNATRN